MSRGRLILASGVVAAVGVGGSYAGFAATSAATVNVTEKEFKLTAKPLRVKPGKVTFVVKNAGKLNHELVVLKTNLAPAKLPVKGQKAVEVGRVGKIPQFKPGVTKKLTLTLKGGKYVLICNVPVHYKAGQRTAFVVG